LNAVLRIPYTWVSQMNQIMDDFETDMEMEFELETDVDLEYDGLESEIEDKLYLIDYDLGHAEERIPDRFTEETVAIRGCHQRISYAFFIWLREFPGVVKHLFIHANTVSDFPILLGMLTDFKLDTLGFYGLTDRHLDQLQHFICPATSFVVKLSRIHLQLLVPFLELNPQITDLSLRGNWLENVDSLVGFLTVACQIKHLDVSENLFSSMGFIALLLNLPPRLKTFYAYPIPDAIFDEVLIGVLLQTVHQKSLLTTVEIP
jgi:hypothetical protein